MNNNHLALRSEETRSNPQETELCTKIVDNHKEGWTIVLPKRNKNKNGKSSQQTKYQNNKKKCSQISNEVTHETKGCLKYKKIRKFGWLKTSLNKLRMWSYRMRNRLEKPAKINQLI